MLHGHGLSRSDVETEFVTLRGEARVFCTMQDGIKQWERGQALCIHRADLLYAVKYIVGAIEAVMVLVVRER
jgi:hypothetical protein